MAGRERPRATPLSTPDGHSPAPRLCGLADRAGVIATGAVCLGVNDVLGDGTRTAAGGAAERERAGGGGGGAAGAAAGGAVPAAGAATPARPGDVR